MKMNNAHKKIVSMIFAVVFAAGITPVNPQTAKPVMAEAGAVTAEDNNGSNKIDTLPPEIEILPPGGEYSNSIDNIVYYNEKNREIKVEVTDAQLNPEETKVVFTKEINGKDIEVEKTFSEDDVVFDGENNKYILTAELDEDALYKDFYVYAQDHAKNFSVSEELKDKIFIIDTEKPKVEINVSGDISGFFINENNDSVYVELNEKAEGESGSLSGADGKSVTVTVTVTDLNVDDSGTERHFENKENFVRNLRSGWTLEQSYSVNADSSLKYTKTMTVSGDVTETVIFDFDIRDLAGNEAEAYTISDERLFAPAHARFIQDGAKLTGKVTADRSRPSSTNEHTPPEIRMIPSASVNTVTNSYGREVRLYDSDMSYEMTVTDPYMQDEDGTNQYSGLASVSWFVESDQEGLILTAGSNNYFSGEQSVSLTVPVIINGVGETNDITVTVTAVDFAGNLTVYRDYLAIDNRAPRVKLVYDNNSVLNGRYFNADRNLTLRVEDLNFDAGRTSVATRPDFSGWSQSGNVWTAAVSYNADGDYTIEMTAEDKAGNRADIDYTDGGANAAPQAFTIDKTLPKAEITGVENRQSYTGDVRPSVIFEDVNFDPNGCSVDWNVTKTGGRINLTERADVSSVTHGAVYTLENFKRITGNDGIYTLSATITDLAGNTGTTGAITYSLNRFGSVYTAFDAQTQNLLREVFTNKAPQLQILETNPNRLKSAKVTVSANGTTRTLEERKDYKVNKSENEDEWKQYLYTIFDSAFTDEKGSPVQGEYFITIYSEDEAGNQNSNRTNAESNTLSITYTIDNEKPTGFINVKGLKEGGTSIRADAAEISVYWEDNIGLKRVDIYANDTLYKILQGEELADAGGFYEFTLAKSDELQSVYAVLTDLAQNEAVLDKVSFYLKSAAPARMLHEKPAFNGGIAGGIVVAIALAAAAVAALVLVLLMKRGSV